MFLMRLRPQILLVLAVLVLASCGPELAVRPTEPATPTPAPTRLPYNPDNLETVTRRDLLDSVSGRATIAPKLTDELFFERDGRVGTVEVAAGDQVTEGQVLARLEQSDLEYQIELAQIDVDLARLRAEEATEQEASTVEQAIADKEVERAELALERLETEQASLEIRAPYPGRIDRIDLNEGEEITAFQAVATIIGTEELIILAEFSGAKASRVTIGMDVQLEDFFDASKKFTGTVAGQAEATSSALVIEPAADAPQLNLGDTWKITAVLGRAPNVLTLPSAAVKIIGDRRYVLTVDDGELNRVFVETGIETDGVIEIRSGLTEGQQISAR
jgi:RND family efflux transporter MFP subunit